MSKQKNMTGQIATLKKVMHYLKHYIPILILSVVLATVTVALTLYFPILTGRAIDLILDKGNVDFPGILAIAWQHRCDASRSGIAGRKHPERKAQP